MTHRCPLSWPRPCMGHAPAEMTQPVVMQTFLAEWAPRWCTLPDA